MRHMMGMIEDDAGLAVIGAAHWDIVGRADCSMALGADSPGLITRQPGGVAATVAVELAKQEMPANLFAAVGDDREGDLLTGALAEAGLDTNCILRAAGSRTDSYLVIEDQTAMVAAIADCRCLERSEPKILTQLADWLAQQQPRPTVAVDGNMSVRFLNDLCRLREGAGFELIYLAASPDKASRARRLAAERGTTLYLNRLEAASLCGKTFDNSGEAARALIESGFEHAVVTDSDRAASDADSVTVVSVAPGASLAAGITGAGDRFAAAHIAGQRRGLGRRQVLQMAHAAAACAQHGQKA